MPVDSHLRSSQYVSGSDRGDVMLFKRWAENFSNDLAIDLGTANTLVFVRGEGIVLNEPSVVAIHEADHSIIAVGREAKAMLGRTPDNIRVIRPLKDGVIADFEITEKMLGYFISQTHRRYRTILRPRVVVGVPSGITQVERRAVRDAAMHAGARAVYLVEQPVAAAMGAGLPIQEPGGNLIVDIGGGTTEVAVLSLAGVIYCKSVRIAGDKMDETILQHIRKHYNLLIGERRAEEIKINLGSAYPGEGERTMEVKGRDLVDGFPKSVVLTEDEIREALRDSVMTIVETVRTCLEQTPPELAADIVDTGIVITGGGGLLRGLDRLLGTETQLPVTVAQDPMSCVALGVGKVLDERDLLTKVEAVGLAAVPQPRPDQVDRRGQESSLESAQRSCAGSCHGRVQSSYVVKGVCSLDLQLPARHDWAVQEQHYGKLVMEPFEPGFALTVGIAYRRVLLSAIHGAAPTWVKIEHVLHEFSHLPGVMEDT